MNCIDKCSENCVKKEACYHVSGVCIGGCLDGFVGSNCNKCKKCLQSFSLLNVFEDYFDTNDRQSRNLEYHCFYK